MKITRSLENETAILHTQGRRWQESDNSELLNMINDTIDRGHLKVLIDLSEFPIMNSSGLDSHIATMKAVVAASGDLVLMSVNDRLINLLRVTKLVNINKVFDLEGEALNYVKS